MQVQKYKFTIIGFSYLTGFGLFLSQKNTGVEFQDSNRYFNNYFTNNSFWAELIEHTGRNVQTLLFSVFNNFFNDIGTSAVFANLIVWILASTCTLYFLEKNVKNYFVKNLSLLLTILIFTSHLVASWIIAILSESIALSFLIPTLIIATLTIFKELNIEDSKNFILGFHILLFLSQPIWGALLVPLVLVALFPWKQNIKQLAILGFVSIFSMAIATLSHNLPYENTGLTFKGFESLTRVYAFSFPNRFGEVALGKNIQDCPLAMDLVFRAQSEGSPTPLFHEFIYASSGCEELVSELNEGKSNSIPKLIFNDFSKTISMLGKATFAIANQQPLYGAYLSSRPLGVLTSDLIVPFGLLLVGSCLFLIKDASARILINLSNLSFLLGGYLLYFQVGIEGERHTLPVAIAIGITSWLVIIQYFGSNKKENS